VQIALAALTACTGLDPERLTLYVDLVLGSISEVARRALQTMKPANYEFQSEFARHYFARGKTEGKAEGRAEGRVEGRAEGKVEGRAEGKVEGRVGRRARQSC
jgi:flagellar biosynthesis/type III secretory pathway protein FliH